MSLNFITLIISTFLLFNGLNAASSSVQVFIYSDDSSIDKNEFRDYTDKIFLDKKRSGIDLFSIYHFSTTSAFAETWQSKKRTSQYYPQKVDCEFDQCANLGEFIESKRSNHTKLFYSAGHFQCDLIGYNVENSPFEFTIEGINSKIQNEIILNKKLGSDLCLIFYIPTSSPLSKPELNANKNTYEMVEDESISFDLIFSNCNEYLWSPSIGLSCSDCETPEVSPRESTEYVVYGINELGCKTDPVKLTVNVKRKCSGYGENKILFRSDRELYRNVYGEARRYLIASDQPGSQIYYLICAENCCKEFNINLINSSGNSIWKKNYSLDDVIENPKLGIDHPGTFIFKIDLEDALNFNSREFYTFRIACDDEQAEQFKIYNSPQCKFVDCGFSE